MGENARIWVVIFDQATKLAHFASEDGALRFCKDLWRDESKAHSERLCFVQEIEVLP